MKTLFRRLLEKLDDLYVETTMEIVEIATILEILYIMAWWFL